VRAIYGLALVAVPGPAAAHDAFGDLGAFYQGLLHPLADPAQGLVVTAAAVLLARHTLDTFRPAYLALVAASAATIMLGAAAALPLPDLRMQSLLALCVAIYALLPFRAGPKPVAVAASILGMAASLSIDTEDSPRAMLLGILGGVAGIALLTLFLWAAIDWAGERISFHAGSVAAAWLAAISVMALVLPA
jgi:hypothetical protein